MRTLDVYVLGAGASYDHGAPLTDEILRYALTQAGVEKDPRIKLLRRFLKTVFGFDPGRKKKLRPDTAYPGLVDVLSIVDMSLDRRESLSRTYDSGKLREVRGALEFAIFEALRHSLSRESTTGRRSDVTKKFVNRLRKKHSAIISFNYDLVIDSALQGRLSKDQYGDIKYLPNSHQQLARVDYGMQFWGTKPPPHTRERFRLLKLHGSLNWLHDPLTDEVYYGGLKKIVGAVFDDHGKAARDLESFFGKRPEGLEPMMITPTHLKDLRNVHVASLWMQAGDLLRTATSITFIGYSLPGDDLHIKYLFKRALQARAKPPKITLVNWVSPEERARLGKGEKAAVVQNYERFFGTDVKAHLDGFETYVKSSMPARAGRS